MSDPSPLSYATPDADGLPEFVPGAEMLIDEGNKWRRLRRLFGSRLDAARYFAKSLKRRRALGTLGESCECCGGHAEGWTVPVDWSFNINAGFLDFLRRTQMVRFRTYHSVCRPCWNRWMERIIRWAWFPRVLRWLAFGAVAIAVVGILLNRTRLAGSPFSHVIRWAGCGAMLCGIMVEAIRWSYPYLIPPRLRKALPPMPAVPDLQRPLMRVDGDVVEVF